MKKHSLYDAIFLIDGDIDNIKLKISASKLNPKLNILATTLNHRNFSIKQINNIRSEIENLEIDHLMLSLRPSANIPKDIMNNNFLQLIFALKICEIYQIKKIFISKKYENLIFDKNLFHKIEDFVKILNKKVKSNKIVSKKSFTFFNSLELGKKNKFEKIEFINLKKFSSNDVKFKIYHDINTESAKFFWLGFDRNYQEVPWGKKYSKDSWYKYVNKKTTKPEIFPKINYCSRCCLPETWEGIKFDSQGICSICKSAEDKMTIEWKNKEKELKKIFKKYKNDDYYDCLLPISGGKDSTFQSFVLTKKYNLNPLAITHGQNWYSLTGRKNLENCIKQFDLDHLFFCAARKKINDVAKKSLGKIGDACWHCHIGVGTFSWQTSIDWKIRLIVFGEAPADTDARGSFRKKEKITPYRNIKISAIEKNNKFTSKKFDLKKLSNWSYPNQRYLKKFSPEIIHLGQFMFWDEQKNIDFVSKHFGWTNSMVENTYKGYKSNECVMAGVHDYINFLKRGIGRATVHASDDVRRGLITREQGFNLIKEHDIKKPHAMTYYKKITGLNDKEIKRIILKARKKSKYASKLKI